VGLPFYQFERRLRAHGVTIVLGPALTGPKGDTRRLYELERDGKVVGTRFHKGNAVVSDLEIDALCVALGLDPHSLM
jgi:hypothetical protein